MAVKIRLKRMGKVRTPFYRVVVVDSRKKRDGRVIEEIGTYNPKTDPSTIHVDSERARYWLGVGAQPTEPVAALLKVTGDWQQYKGEAAPEPMRAPETKRDKTEVFNEALKEAAAEPKSQAKPRKRAKAEPKAAEADTKAEEKAEEKAEATATEASEASAEESTPDESKADQPAPADSDTGSDSKENGES